MQSEMKTYIPTAEEWKQALDVTRHRRSSHTLDVAKTVILLLVTAYCWVPFFITGFKEGFNGLKWDGFVLGCVALIVALALWLVPLWALSRDAIKIAARQVTVHLTLTEEGLGMGEGEQYQCVPFEKICGIKIPCGLALGFDNASISVVPDRVLTAEEAAWLCDRLLKKEKA